MNYYHDPRQEHPAKAQPIRYATFKFPLQVAQQMVADRYDTETCGRVKLNLAYLKDTLDRYCHCLADLPREGYLFYGPDARLSMLYVLRD